MKAYFKTAEGSSDSIEYEAIVPQPMQHVDGFTLLGFDTWEDVTDEKLAYAVTNVVSFKLDKNRGKVGFHGQD